jgi:hypothetical protein
VSQLRPVEPLDPKRHQVKDFRCGQPSLDRWLQAYAGQSQRQHIDGADGHAQNHRQTPVGTVPLLAPIATAAGRPTSDRPAQTIPNQGPQQ